MNVRVKSCHNCIMQRVRDKVYCRLTNEVIQGAEGDGGPNHVFEQTMPKSCPLLDGEVSICLDRNALYKDQAYIGYRVLLHDGRKGVISAKWMPNEKDQARYEELQKPGAMDKPMYHFLADGSNEGIEPIHQDAIKNVIGFNPKYNFHDAFEFVFGFGPDDDVSPT